MEPADRPGPQRDEVVASVGEQAQHRGVIDRPNELQRVVAQRHDRRGAGVVRVALVGAPRVQQPSPGRERRRHVQDGLAGGDELLGQQRAEPAGGFDGPRPRFERRGELEQPVALSTIRGDTELADDDFSLVEHRGGVGPLVRVDPDDEHNILLMAVRW